MNEAALLALGAGPLIGGVIGVVYFLNARTSSSLRVRLLTSAFGPSLIVMFLLAGVLWPERYRYTSIGVHAYYWIQLLPFFLLVFALVKYPGNRRLHLILMPLGLLAWAGTFAWGWLFVHGE